MDDTYSDPRSPQASSEAALDADVAKVLLEAAIADYKDASETWSRIETKAQGAIAVAGIFLAAVFALARDAEVLNTPYVPFAVASAVVVLVGSVVSALLALRVRLVPRPPTEVLHELVNDLADVTDTSEIRKRIPGFYGDQADAWRKVTDALSSTNLTKANNLWAAQLFLVVAVVIVAATTVYLLLF